MGAEYSQPQSPTMSTRSVNWTPGTAAQLTTHTATGGRALNMPRGRVGPGGASVRVYGGRSYVSKPTTAHGPQLGPGQLSAVLNPAVAPHIVANNPRYNPSVTDRRGTVMTANIASGYINAGVHH